MPSNAFTETGLRHLLTYDYDSQVRQKVNFSRRFLKILTLLLLAASANAQQTAVTQAPFNVAAYRIGERLTYNVNYSQFVSAAHVELVVVSRGTYYGRDGIQLRGHVETSGVVNVALLSLNNDYTSFVYADSGLPYRGIQVVREAGRTTEAAVDYNQPAGTEAIPPKLQTGEFPGTYDLLSALYRIRATPLTPGSSFTANVRNENEEYRADIRVTGKQLVKTNVGSFDAIATKINLKNGPDYNLRAYFSDDEWHVPVLVTARYKGADISIELAGSELMRRPVPGAAAPAVIEPVPNPTPVVTPTPLGNSSTVRPPAFAVDLPFRPGEELNYRVYSGNTNVAVGSLNFALKSRGKYFNRDGLQLVWQAQTSGGGILPIKDQITSYVDPATLIPFRTEINFAEGSYRATRNYNMDQDRGMATLEGKPDRIEIPVGTHDLLSAFYAIRTFDLSPSRQNAISIMAVNHPRTLTIKSERRETIELNGQKIPAVIVSLTTDDPQPDKLQVRIWISEDSRRLPVRIAATTGIGAVRADLIIRTN